MTTQIWQQELAQAITDPFVLLDRLSLNVNEAFLEAALKAAQLFPLRVPEGFVARMKKGHLHDPLLRQVLPLDAEYRLQERVETACDPLEEQRQSPVHGLLHKYYGRVLLILGGACAIHCRYCFRRHFPYQEHTAYHPEQWNAILAYIASDKSINEVIFSGGDPLMIKDQKLKAMIEQLVAIKHVECLRIHTRLPIVLPERVTDSLLDLLENSSLRCVVVVHANHAQEIDDQVAQALQSLHQRGVTLLNQSVLLRGVNDSVQAIVQLSQKLFSVYVMPYYMHLLDPVRGVIHFEVGMDEAKSLMSQASARLPGYLVPKLVREVAFEASKQLLL